MIRLRHLLRERECQERQMPNQRFGSASSADRVLQSKIPKGERPPRGGRFASPPRFVRGGPRLKQQQSTLQRKAEVSPN